MKSTFTLICFCLSIGTWAQQNLVPNPSFEDTLYCPIGQNPPLSCTDWYRPYQVGGGGATSDYFNSCGGVSFNAYGCDIQTTSGTPQNCMGYQDPRTGEGYCGFLAYVDVSQGYKEYIGSKLLEPMIENRRYCVEFFVSLADSSHFAVHEIAAFFGPDSLPQVSTEPLSIVPQVINNNGVIEDKDEWIKITGYYTASGNEKYMFIGSYNDYANTTIVNLTSGPLGDSSNGNYLLAYYYVDDVSVCLQESGVCACEEYNVIDNTADYILPNVFSPNGDLINDFWTTNFVHDDEYVVILNRWGNEMIRLDIDNPIWNGQMNGREISEGTYFYTAWMRGELNHGFIQIVR